MRAREPLQMSRVKLSIGMQPTVFVIYSDKDLGRFARCQRLHDPQSCHRSPFRTRYSGQCSSSMVDETDPEGKLADDSKSEEGDIQ